MITEILFAFLTIFIIVQLFKRPKNFPPGPRGYSFLSTTILFLRRRQFYYKAANILSKKYGPVVGFYLGPQPVIFVSGLKAVKECLTNDIYNGRPARLKLHTFGKARLGIIFTDDEFWREQKRFSLSHLKDLGFGRHNLEPTMHEEISDLLEKMQLESENTPGNILTVYNLGLFGVSIINVLWAMMAGERFKHTDDGLKNLLDVVGGIFRSGTITGGAFNVIPIFKYIAPKLSGYEENERRQKALQDFIQESIEQHKKTFDENSLRDFIDVYLKELKQTEHSLHSSFSELQLLVFCVDMFMAGAETTSNFLAFSVLHMILHPDVQKKVQNELDEVVGKGTLPSLTDRKNLPYTEATLNEIFRVSNIAPFAGPHRPLDEAELMGYTIPKNSVVMLNLWSIHMDKEHWGDPESFRPERFLKEGKIVRDEWFVPFGIGKRACIGESLARDAAILFFAALMQKFSFSIPPGEFPDTEPFGGLTQSPKPFKVRILSRV